MGDIFIVESHIVNRNTILVMGEYALLGRPCTRIMEGNRSFLVDKAPLIVIDKSIQHIGFSLKGAIESSKAELGKTSMVPIMINPAQNVCLFPIISPYKHECIWFNPLHIIDAKPNGNKTDVYLSNGCVITVDMRLSTFISKWHRAKQLCDTFSERAQNEMTSIYMKPKKKLLIIKEENGMYNFDELKKEMKEEE